MWLMVMFDLPVGSREERHVYSKFRKQLLKDGFMLMQFSIYIRPCSSEENAAVHRGRVKQWIPEEGHVRVLTFTDKQFGRMEVHIGKTLVKPENQPEQLSFF